jgi:hypothetical protein
LFGLVKGKLLALGGAIIAILLGVVKALSARNRQLKDRAKKAESGLKFQNSVIESEQEIDSKFSDLKREAEKDVKDGSIPSHLRDPRD